VAIGAVRKAKQQDRKVSKKQGFARSNFSKLGVVVFALVFTAAGVYLFLRSNAAGTVTQPPVAPDVGKQWQLNFAEEFDGTDYDHNKLTPCFDWNTGSCTSTFNHGREHYQPSQVQVSNGSAKLVAEPLSPPLSNSNCQNSSCTYKAGLISTARPLSTNGSNYLYKFTYGYVETRIKYPATQGFFTAFWMLPADPTFNYKTELDIAEILGDDPSSIFMTYWYNNRSTSFHADGGVHNNGACPVKDYSQDWMTLGVDWQPTHIAWYINGVKCGQFNGNSTTIESGPMQIIEHMMVDNDWQRSWGVGLKDPTLSRQLEVDYLRVWQQTSATSDTTPPTVSLTAPAAGSTVSGSSVAVSANASDNVGVSGVQFKLDGANLGAEDTASPYSASWDSTKAVNGSHTLTAVARDAAGNTATSSAATVTVNNSVSPPPPPPPPIPPPPPKTGDLNNDNAVNVFDLSILLSKYNTTTASADLNNDGIVNVFDLSILLSHYGT
jgi:beta-glucanase (GH16 family)